GGCAPTPSNLTPSAAFTLTASGSQPQDYIFNLQGAGSDALSTTHAQPVTLRVVDYSLGQPPQINLPYPAAIASSTFVVSSLGQFNQAITFDCTSLPAGASCSFNPPSVTLGPNQQTNAQVTVTGSNALLGGSYALVIEGLSAGAPSPRTATLNLVVADYSLGTNPRTREIYPGQTANYTGAVSAINGYNSSVVLSCVAGATAAPASCLLDGVASETVSPPANFALTASDTTI